MHGYDNDFFLWAQEQAELLRTGKLAEVDRSNLADEMDSLARGLKRELGSRFSRLQQHLLQWEYLDGARVTAWYLTIHDERSAIPLPMEDAPSAALHGRRVCQRLVTCAQPNHHLHRPQRTPSSENMPLQRRADIGLEVLARSTGEPGLQPGGGRSPIRVFTPCLRA